MSQEDLVLLWRQGLLVSLSHVAVGTPYPSEYLGLLARKGKIPALKVSRDWFSASEIVLLYAWCQQVRGMFVLSPAFLEGGTV